MNKQHFTDFQIRKEFLHILERMNITCPTVIQVFVQIYRSLKVHLHTYFKFKSIDRLEHESNFSLYIHTCIVCESYDVSWIIIFRRTLTL